MTEKDHADLVWAMGQNVDYIALSFVRTAQDCIEAKQRIKELNTAHSVGRLYKRKKSRNLKRSTISMPLSRRLME